MLTVGLLLPPVLQCGTCVYEKVYECHIWICRTFLDKVLSNGLHPELVTDRSIAQLDRFQNTGADDGWRNTSKRSVEHFDSKT